MAHTEKAKQYIENLKTAIKAKDKRAILKCYEECEADETLGDWWDTAGTELTNQYDDLVSEANDILYEEG